MRMLIILVGRTSKIILRCDSQPGTLICFILDVPYVVTMKVVESLKVLRMFLGTQMRQAQ
jgi:hypothetical protein